MSTLYEDWDLEELRQEATRSGYCCAFKSGDESERQALIAQLKIIRMSAELSAELYDQKVDDLPCECS